MWLDCICLFAACMDEQAFTFIAIRVIWFREPIANCNTRTFAFCVQPVLSLFPFSSLCLILLSLILFFSLFSWARRRIQIISVGVTVVNDVQFRHAELVFFLNVIALHFCSLPLTLSQLASARCHHAKTISRHGLLSDAAQLDHFHCC